MKNYKTQAEVDADLVDGNLTVKDDVTFDFARVGIPGAISAGHINAGNINAGDINACDINAGHINARNINAWNIDAWDINARDIKAWDIDAWDINARNINAWDISYYAVAFAYNNITCKSISSRRENGRHFVLDGEIKIEKEK